MAFWIYLALVIFVLLPALSWIIRVRILKQDRIIDPLCCERCGYNLQGLSVPRCPECGAAVGFTKTFNELGVDEAEVIRHTDRQRSKSAKISAADQPSEESEPLQ
jgi:hypothetical protein